MSFGKNMGDMVKTVKTSVDEVVAGVFHDVCMKIVEDTPIGDITRWKNPPKKGYEPGTLVNSWYAGVGSIPVSINARVANNNGSDSKTSISAAEENFPGNVGYFVNPTVYANRVEYIGWPGNFTYTPPYRFVGLTVNSFAQIAKIAINKYKVQ